MQTFAMPVLVTVRARDGREAMELMAQAMMKAQGVPGVIYRRPLDGFAEPIEEPEPTGLSQRPTEPAGFETDQEEEPP